MYFTLYHQHHQAINTFPSIHVVQLGVADRKHIVQYVLEKDLLRLYGKGDNEDVEIITKDGDIFIDVMLQEGRDLVEVGVEFPIVLEVIEVHRSNQLGSLSPQVDMDNWEYLGKIGQGTFAEIFLVRNKSNHSISCLKKLSKSRCHKIGHLQHLANQFYVLTTISSNLHPTLYFAFEDTHYLYFIMQFCPYGDLYTLILDYFKFLTLYHKVKYFVQVCLEIGKLHEDGWIYRDLKPENVLIDCRGNAKLCDFGYARKIQPGEILYEMCGSYEYLPPELIRKEGYNKTYDFYCLGLFFYELLTSENPYKGITPQTLNLILHRSINFHHPQIPSEAKPLLKQLLHPNPKERPSFIAEIFKHELFELHRDVVMEVLKGQETPTKGFPQKIIRGLKLREHHKESINISILPNKFYNYLKSNLEIDGKPGGPELDAN